MVTVRELVWENWNKSHIARHSVSKNEVEEVCQGQHVTSKTYAGRLRVIGRTNNGKSLTIILAPKDKGKYYPVTARPASRKERKIFDIMIGGEIN